MDLEGLGIASTVTSLIHIIFVLVYSEYWVWESLAFISGHLGVTAQANMMITIQIAASINTLSLGIQEAACVLIGN